MSVVKKRYPNPKEALALRKSKTNHVSGKIVYYWDENGRTKAVIRRNKNACQGIKKRRLNKKGASVCQLPIKYTAKNIKKK